MAVQLTRAGVALTVGIIVVAGLLIGGLFVVKHSGEQARHDEAVKIAEQNLAAQNNTDVALNEGDDKAGGEGSGDKAGSKVNNEGVQNAQSTQNTQGAQDVQELPQTGASDISAIVIAGVVTYVAVAYGCSRQPRFETR